MSKVLRQRDSVFHEDTGRIERIDGLVKCDCGALVDLTDCMTNTCDKCGADYDGSGSRLADRRFWGEETGESLADIMGIGKDPEEV